MHLDLSLVPLRYKSVLWVSNEALFFQMTVFLVSPFIGMGISRFGVKRTLNVGIGTVGVVLVFYGCLGLLKSGPLFLGLSMGLRYESTPTEMFLDCSTGD